jgi:DNA integrity scanning protein DisA with diadenylate cyclase activity
MKKYIESRIYLNLESIEKLLINIFILNTPLQVDAIIIKDKKVIGNWSYFSLT